MKLIHRKAKDRRKNRLYRLWTYMGEFLFSDYKWRDENGRVIKEEDSLYFRHGEPVDLLWSVQCE